MKYIAPVSFIIVIGLMFINSGCGSNTTDSNSQSSKSSHGDHDHSQHDEDGLTDMQKMKKELAKLSPEDRSSAEKQHTCLVSGEMLGTMGVPQKVKIKDKEVWICCDGCKKELLENPDKYLSKLE